MAGNGYNQVYSGCAPQPCGCNGGSNPMPSDPTNTSCDAIKQLSISMGTISGITCNGESFTLPINVINPKSSNAEENINKALFDICASIPKPLSIESGDDCIEVEESDCDVEIALNVGNLISKICADANIKTALQECIDTDTDVHVSNFTYDATTGDVVIEQNDGSDFTITIPPVTETVTTLVDNGDNTFTYTNEEGVTTNVNMCCDDIVTTLIVNPDGSFTYTNEDGVTTTVNHCCEDETVTTLTLTEDGFEYVSEDGTITIYEAPEENLTSLVDNGDGTFSYTDENGDVVTIDYCNCPVVQVISSDGTVSVTNTGTAEAPIFDLSVTHTVDINVDMFTYDPATKIITLTETDGTVHTINVSDLVDAEVVTTMVIQVDGSTVYTNENGVQTIIPAPVTVKSTDSSINVASTGTATAPCYDISYTENPETVTSLVDTGTSFSYTNEDGVTVVVDYCCDDVLTSVTENTDGGFTYIDEEGNPVTIPGTCTYLENLPDVPADLPRKIIMVDPIDGGCGLAEFDFVAKCDQIDALQAQIDALPPDTNTTSVISGFVAGANPGEYTVTLTESDGSTSTATLTVPGSTFDGTTITLSDGTTFTPSPDDDITAVIGSQVDANGEATVTVEEGATSFTATITCIQPLLMKKLANGDVVPSVKGDAFLSDAINPVVDISGGENGACLTDCDGNEVGGFSVFTELTNAGTLMNPNVDEVVSTTPVGPIVDTEHCFDVDVPKCGGRIDLMFFVGGSLQERNGGDVTMTVRYSVDGGPPRSTTSSGVQQYILDQVAGETHPNIGEFESVRTSETQILPAGPHTICAWIEVTGNNLDAGSVFGMGSFSTVARTQRVRVC